MSSIDPASRPWRRPGTARAMQLASWIVALACWVPVTATLGMSDATLGMPAQAASAMWMMIALVVTAGAGFVDYLTRKTRTDGDTGFIARAFGSAVAGLGLGWAGMLLIGGSGIAMLLIGPAILLCAIGVVVFFIPVMVTRSRRDRAEREAVARRTGAAATGVLTEVNMFFRDGPYPYYACTIAFTDHAGTRRWVKRTAPPEVFGPEVGESVTVHYDSAKPGKNRSIVITWPQRRF